MMTFEIFNSMTGQTVDTVFSEQEAQKRTLPGTGLDYSAVSHNRNCYCDSAYHKNGC